MKTFTWVIIVAVVIIAALVIKHCPPPPPKPKDVKSETPRSESPTSSQSLSFTPDELVSIAQSYDIDNIAGACVDRQFKPFKQGSEAKTYYYYKAGSFNNYSVNEGTIIKYMNELLIFSDTSRMISYVFKEKHNYDKFVSLLGNYDSLKLKAKDRVLRYKDREQYAVGESIIVLYRYKDTFEGYTIYIMPAGLLKISAYLESDRPKTSEQNQFPKTGYIKESGVMAYSYPASCDDSEYEEIVLRSKKLQFGDQVKIIKEKGKAFYCTYEFDGEPQSGWICKKYISPEKPKSRKLKVNDN